MFSANVFDAASFEPVPTQKQLKLTPQRWSAKAVGGFDKATINVSGLESGLWEIARWLRFGVEIRNKNDSIVWAGFINEAQLEINGVQVTLSLDEMTNRVQVLYTYETVDGDNESGETTWVEDSGSIGRYGYKELRHSQADTTPTAADTLRDLILSIRKKAVASFDFRGSESASGTLHCLGWWHTLGWRYYANSLGRNDSTETGQYQALGLGFTSTEVAVTKAKHNTFAELNGYFLNFDAEQKITVSGSGSNDDTYRIKGADGTEPVVYTTSAFRYETADDFFDDDQGFGWMDTGRFDIFSITGAIDAASLNADFMCEQWGAGGTPYHMEIHPGWRNGPLTNTDQTGNELTFKRGNAVEVYEATVNEHPTNSVTVVQHGQKIAQYVTNTTGSAWTVDKIGIEICHVGSPTDDVTVALYSNNSGVPGSLLASGTIDADDVGDAMAWLWADLGNTYSFATGTGYWIVVSRGGANDWDDFYRIGIDEDTAHTGSQYLLWNGSTWVQRPDAAKLAFSIWGAEDTTAQVDSIVTAKGEFITTVSVADISGVETNQYRDGTNTAMDEIEDLLAVGDSSGNRMICHVTPKREFIIKAAPSQTDEYTIIYRGDGTLRYPLGGELDPGKLVAGSWLEVEGIPASVDALLALTPVFVESDEFEVSSMRNRPRPQASVDPWDILSLGQG